MRTLLLGLIGGALIFTFFWYRGDVGVISLPGVGEIAPPTAAAASPAGTLSRAIAERLQGLRADARAVHAQFEPVAPVVDLSTAPEIYAGQLIAKPREDLAAAAPGDAAAGAPSLRTADQPQVAAEVTEEQLEGRLTARSLAVQAMSEDALSAPVMELSNALSALQVANEVGVVDTTVGGGAMLINLDYDLIDEAQEEAAPAQDAAPAPDAGAGVAPGAPALRRLEVAPVLELAPSVAGALQFSADTPNAALNAAPNAALAQRSLGLEPSAESQARPLAFNAGDALRDRAMRSQSRRLAWAEEACPETVDAAALRDDPGLGVSCAIERLRASGQFEYVEPNIIVTHEFAPKPGPTLGLSGPNDPFFGFQWSYRNQGDGVDQSAGGAGFEDFWSRVGEGSRDIVVAVIDTGLDMSHPDIAGSPNVAQGIDMVSVPFYGNDDDGRDLDPNDPGDICDTSDPEASNSYHGTHVAGTIGAVATNDGEGVAGGAWNVTIVPIRAMGRCGGLQSDINDAIRWAAGVESVIIETADGVQEVANENPADIINLSLGFRAPDGCPRSTQEAIDDAVAAGAIVVAAAGNAGINVSGYGPSGCNNVVTVAAGDGAGSLAYYSNWGDGVDIMAPGGDLRQDLDGDGRPDGILSTKHVDGGCVDALTGDPLAECNYSYENGTSMAAPHISAALALLKSADPGSSNDSLIAELVDTARNPRTLNQCVGPCSDTPGGTVIDGQPGMCHRACGEGLLDLSLADR